MRAIRALRPSFDSRLSSPPPKGRTVVIGAGKLRLQWLRRSQDLWPWPLTGLVVTRYGHTVPCERIEIVEARHPVPDESGHQAAKRILEMVQDSDPTISFSR